MCTDAFTGSYSALNQQHQQISPQQHQLSYIDTLHAHSLVGLCPRPSGWLLDAGRESLGGARARTVATILRVQHIPRPMLASSSRPHEATWQLRSIRWVICWTRRTVATVRAHAQRLGDANAKVDTLIVCWIRTQDSVGEEFNAVIGAGTSAAYHTSGR